MMTPRWILGFVGHRRVPDREGARHAIHETLAQLASEAEAQGAKLEIHLSCAIGADMLCIESARELGLPIHLILPLAEKEFLKDFKESHERDVCQEEIAKAARGERGSTLRVCQSNGVRPDCYYDMSREIVHNADALLVFWNGKEARGLGGTAEIYALAGHMGRPLGWIHSETHAFTREQWPDAWPEPDPEMTKLAAALEEAGSKADTIPSAEALAKALSAMNRKNAPFFRRMVTSIIWINAAAALLGATAIVSSKMNQGVFNFGPAMWTTLNFVLILVAAYLIRYLRKRQVYNRWVRGRMAAEILRGVRATQPAFDPLDPMVRQRAPEWARFALTVSLETHRQLALDTIEAFRDHYVERRLENQMTHFETFGSRAVVFERRMTRISEMAALAGPICVGLVFFNKIVRHLDVDWVWQRTMLGALFLGLIPVIFPLVAGTAASLNSAFDARRRSKRYPELVDHLGRIRDEIKELRTPASILDAVKNAETLLLNELLEWRSTTPHKAAKKR